MAFPLRDFARFRGRPGNIRSPVLLGNERKRFRELEIRRRAIAQIYRGIFRGVDKHGD